MSSKFDKKRLKLAAQGLRKTAISLQAGAMSLLQAADSLITSEFDDNLVDNNSSDVNLQDLFSNNNINGALSKFLGDALNNENEALNDAQIKKRTRKPRPPRDPNAPIKPQNAFAFYQKDVVNQVREENKGKPWPVIVHLIGIRWKNLPKEEKDRYVCQFKAAKKSFEVDYKAYMESKVQEAAADVNSYEENNNTSTTSNSISSTSLNEDGNEENEKDEEDTLHLKVKSNTKNVPTSQTGSEFSSEKKSKKRKPHENEDDDNERPHEEEESLRKLKKKCSKEENDEVQGKEHKTPKKSSHPRHG